MPVPLVLGLGAAAGLTGVGSGIHGAVKMKNASDTLKSADLQYKQYISKFENQYMETNISMDMLGELELRILKSFNRFSIVFEKIQNRPKFKKYTKDGIQIPKYNGEKIKEVSVGADVLLGGLGGAAVGTAGGFAAAGAATAAVMAFGTASTGTAISSLSGAAAVNATLAALGGGAIAAGGGGIALGTTVLSVTTLGVGLLVGGIIFNITGRSFSDKVGEAVLQMQQAEEEINRICTYMQKLSKTANEYKKEMYLVDMEYRRCLKKLEKIIYDVDKTNWMDFTDEERLITENTVLLVGLLYNMCKVQLVQKAEDEEKLNTINQKEIEKSITDAKQFLLKASIY